MSKSVNASGGDRKYWGVIPVLPAPILGQMASRMEDIGYEGATALQIYGPPWASLTAAAAATSRLKVATGVAVAASRSPFETAMIAMDMDRVSQGRFILGLGTGVSSVNVGSYGVPNYKLVTHIRDTIAAVRHVISHAHKGIPPYQGAYYQASFEELMLTAPPVRKEIPIWIAALREKMTDTALEIADGLIVHSLWTVDYTVEQGARIATKLAEFQRERSSIEINAWPWVAVNDNQQQAIDDSRPTVAGYAGIKEYEPFFAARGFLKEAQLCQQGDQSNSLSVMHHVPDEMVKAFVACGNVDQVLEQLEPFWSVVDSLCPMSPYRHLDMEKLMFYGEGLHQLVAAAKR